MKRMRPLKLVVFSTTSFKEVSHMSIHLTPSIVRRKFLEVLSDMEAHLDKYVRNPGHDFVRHRQLPFRDTLLLTMFMKNSSLNGEISDYWSIVHPKARYSTASRDAVPTRAAFIRQRSKLNDSAFPSLLTQFNRLLGFKKLLKGYHLLACDGSDLNIAPEPDDASTYISYNSKKGGYHQLHLTVMYDLLEAVYTDAVIQPRTQMDEQDAFVSMVRRNPVPGKCLFIADRGFDSFNDMATVANAGLFFLFRVKEPSRDTSAFKHLLVSDAASFETFSDIFLCRTHKRLPNVPPDKQKYIRPDRSFDLIHPSDKTSAFHLSFRFIKITLKNGSVEYLVTNLPAKDFKLDDFLDLYHRRWGIETSFLFLKYGISLAFPHSVKRCFQIQEIYAKLILFNVISRIVSCVDTPDQEQTHLKYQYRISISDAIRKCRYYLVDPKTPKDTVFIAYLLRDKIPIRSGKDRPRNMRSQRLHSFQNRT